MSVMWLCDASARALKEECTGAVEARLPDLMLCRLIRPRIVLTRGSLAKDGLPADLLPQPSTRG